MHATKAGDDIWLDLEVPETGSYDLSVVMTQASDYGMVELRLDGSAIGTFDGYAADTVRGKPIGFGIRRLTSGHHALILVVTGKNAKSKNYFVGLDVLRLRRVTP